MADSFRRALEAGGMIPKNTLLNSATGFYSSPALNGLTPRTLLDPGGSQNIPTHFGLRSALAIPVPAHAPPQQWIYVVRRFSQFLANISLTEAQFADGNTKQAGIRNCLNNHYYGVPSDTANSYLIGSWGKQARVRPPRDIDILFLLPSAVYWRYQERAGNIQSQLLQEIKGVLDQKYTRTDISGDRHVVVVPFASMPVEVAVGFICTDGSILVCDSKDGGRYITSTAAAELQALSNSDTAYAGKTRALFRMLKTWQTEKFVPLKSFLLERVVVEFMATWTNNDKDIFFYDWMVRDFFAYLYYSANGHVVMPGTNEILALGSDWQNKAWLAWQHANTACQYEQANNNFLAGQAWQKIFGSVIPVGV